VRKTDPGHPEVCNIYSLHKAFSDGETVKQVYEQCTTAGWGCIDCKKVLLDSMDRELVPIRTRADELRAAPKRLDEVLEAGAVKCRAIARETMRDVRERMGLD
jgi:tryptophanyl-tRNA synthetase